MEMAVSNLVGTSAAEIAALVMSMSVSVEEVVDATLVAIERANPHLNAFIHIDEDGARAAARELQRRLRTGEDVGALAGVPTAMKDLYNTYPGWPSTFGGALPSSAFIADAASTYPRRMRAAGAIMVGATNSPALGFRGTCDNAIFGATSNPFDLQRNSGGSSGGSAAAVGAGLLAIADGTDGGGPSAFPPHGAGPSDSSRPSVACPS